jgi:hypothetical protein
MAELNFPDKNDRAVNEKIRRFVDSAARVRNSLSTIAKLQTASEVTPEKPYTKTKSQHRREQRERLQVNGTKGAGK